MMPANTVKGGTMHKSARGLDHVVHAVQDLDAASELYRQLGFTVGARNKHPWGTDNHIIQLPGFFIELLAFAEPERLGGDSDRQLSILRERFGVFNSDFIARQAGLSTLILESHEAEADVAEYEESFLSSADKLTFAREGHRPDGSVVKVAFSLAFVEGEHIPDIAFATCQQHFPENFWNPAFQKHVNAATGVAGAIIVAQEPARYRQFFLLFSGASSTTADGEGYRIGLPRGVIDVMTPLAFADRFGQLAPDTGNGPRLAALRFKTSEPHSTATVLSKAGIAYTVLKSGAISSVVLGAALVFEGVS
jgi:catechol 2,3-dioxygenase-like lactoylglutathione lyase family enzyme